MLLTRFQELSKLKEAANSLAAQEIKIRQALMLAEARRTVSHEAPEDLIEEFAVPQPQVQVEERLFKNSPRFLRNLKREVFGLSLFSEFLGFEWGTTYLEVQKEIDLTKVYVKRDIDCWYFVEGEDLKEQILYRQDQQSLAVYLPPTFITERRSLLQAGCRDYQTAFFMVFDLHQGAFAERLEATSENNEMLLGLLKDNPYVLTQKGEWVPIQEYEVCIEETFGIISGKNLFLVKPRDNYERRKLLKEVFLNMPVDVGNISNKYEYLSY